MLLLILHTCGSPSALWSQRREFVMAQPQPLTHLQFVRKAAKEHCSCIAGSGEVGWQKKKKSQLLSCHRWCLPMPDRVLFIESPPPTSTSSPYLLMRPQWYADHLGLSKAHRFCIPKCRHWKREMWERGISAWVRAPVVAECCTAATQLTEEAA